MKVLISELCSVKVDTRVNEPATVLNSVFFSTRLPLRITDPVRVLNREFLSVRPDPPVIDEAGFRVHVVGTP